MSGTADDLVRLSETMIRQGSKSFAAAARLFDRETRASAYLLYAWCRHCDDVIDGQHLGHGFAAAGHDPGRRLQELRQQTAAALAGEPVTDPIFAAFRQVIAKHAIPHRHPFELLEGFAMDAAGRRYDTLEDTLSYCYHVAGVVGVMMALIMGVRDAPTLDRASDLGLAFQLTNIARDVIDDARLGRLYLPRRWLSEAGIPAAELTEARHRPALVSVVARLLGEADRYYASSAFGIACLPLRSRWAVTTAHIVYREIGLEVLRRGPAAWDRRVSTSGWTKARAIVGAGARAAAAPLLAQAGASDRAGLWTRPQV